MTFTLGLSGLLAFTLALARAVAWLTVAPPFGDRAAIPAMVRVGIGAGLALAVTGRLAHGPLPTSTAGLLGALVVQVFIGVALGLVVRTLIAAVGSAAELLTVFGGLSLPEAIDPLGLSQSGALATFYQQITIALLFVSGGELMIVQGFLTSFRAVGATVALGRGALAASAGAVLTHDVATLFASALQIAGPVVAVLFVAQIVLGLLAKAAPSLNVFLLGLPLQVLLLILLLAVGIRVLPAAVSDLVGRSVSDMLGLVTGGR